MGRGRVRIAQVRVKKLLGLVWWIKDQVRRGQEITPWECNSNICALSIAQYQIDKHTGYEGDTETVKNPDKTKKGTDWVQWLLSFENYLSGLKGTSGVPLTYIIRKELPVEHEFTSDTERLIHQAPHQGDVYNADNIKVYRIIRDACLNTDAWEWIKGLNTREDGRLAMKALIDHYDGPSATHKRIAIAEEQICTLFYRNEQAWTFEAFVTKLNGAFLVLNENERAYPEGKMNYYLKRCGPTTLKCRQWCL